MKVVFSGSMIISGTGQLGGTVIQGGPYGAIARLNFKPRNRQMNNAFQPCEKESFTNVAKTWRSLSGAQIAAWNAYAIAPLSGYATFLKFNLQYYRINGTFLIAPVALPVVPASIILTSGTFPLPHTFALTYTGTTSVNANMMHIFVILNQSLGNTKPIKSRFRLINTSPLIAGINTHSFVCTVNLVDPVINQSQFIGVRLFDTVTGYLTPLQTIQFNS